MSSRGAFDFTECAICGKKFIEIPCSIYKLRFADKTYHCCSYSCYTEGLKTKSTHNQSEYSRLQKSI